MTPEEQRTTIVIISGDADVVPAIRNGTQVQRMES